MPTSRRTQASRPFDLGVFDQDRVWVTRSGQQRSLAAMGQAELREVVEFLHEHRDVFYLAVLRREVTVRVVSVAGPVSLAGGGSAGGWFAASGQVTWRALGRGPQVWMDRTVLMRRLQYLARVRSDERGPSGGAGPGPTMRQSE